MKLEWRLVDDKLISVTTRETYNQQFDIEVYPLSQYPEIKLDSTQLARVVRNQMSSSVNSIEGALIGYHPTYDCFVAVAPQDIQFQLAKTLRRLNGEEVE